MKVYFIPFRDLPLFKNNAVQKINNTAWLSFFAGSPHFSITHRAENMTSNLSPFGFPTVWCLWLDLGLLNLASKLENQIILPGHDNNFSTTSFHCQSRVRVCWLFTLHSQPKSEQPYVSFLVFYTFRVTIGPAAVFAIFLALDVSPQHRLKWFFIGLKRKIKTLKHSLLSPNWSFSGNSEGLSRKRNLSKLKQAWKSQ